MSRPDQFASAVARPAHEAVRQDAVRAIQRAVSTSKTPFSTLVSIAEAESHFDVNAKNKASSATGPFQITEKTWLELVKRYGSEAGRPDLAAKVCKDANGQLSVASADRATVLDARHDLDLSSKLAAKLCDECRTGLTKNLGRDPTEEEVRLAYFLGVKGATRLMATAETNPSKTVKGLMPQAFWNHRSMLSTHGKPLTAGQALDTLQARYTREIAHTGSAAKAYAGMQLLTAPIEDAPPVPAEAPVQVADATPQAETPAATAEPAPAATTTTAAAVPATSDDTPIKLADAAAKDLECKPTKDGISCAL
jgi:Transglycosylase SLT domain